MKDSLTLLSLLLFVLSFTGCANNDPSINATRLRINLTDAATLVVSEFNVDIQKIEVATTDNTSDEENGLRSISTEGCSMCCRSLTVSQNRLPISTSRPV